MSLGAMLSIATTILVTPILSRIFDKSEFAIFYQYISIITICTLIITGMYPQAFVVPKFKRDFLTLLKLSFVITGIGSFLFGMLLYTFGDPFLTLIGGEDLIEIKWVLVLGLLINSLNVIFINWNIRRKEFKKNAASNVSLSIVSKTYQIGYGTFVNSMFSGLIYGDLLGKIISTLILGAKNMVNDFSILVRIKYIEVIDIAKKFKKYPCYLLGSNFVNRFSSDLPLYIMTSFYGLGAVGAFGFANSMLNMPYRIIGNSIAPVYFQRASEIYHINIEEFRLFTKSSYSKMLLLGSITFGFIFSFGDILFKFIFSDEWLLAGQFAMLLSLYFVFKLISSPFTTIFRVVGKEEYSLYAGLALASLKILSMIIGLLFKSAIVAIGIFSLGNIIGYIYTNMLIFKLLEIPYIHVIRETIVKLFIIFGGYMTIRILCYLIVDKTIFGF